MSDTPMLWEETVQGGATWSHVLKRGTALRITDTEGGANAGALFYNFECPVERYNMPDTLKAQHIARLTEGFVLYSDMGRVLCSITERYVGWHDPIGGCSNARHGRGAKYGDRQATRNAATIITRTRSTAFWWNSASGGWDAATWCRTSISSAASTVADDGAMSFHAGQLPAPAITWNCARR